MQGCYLFYFRDEMSNIKEVKGVLNLEGANISARPTLQEADTSDTDRFCLLVRLAAKSAAVTKHPVYTFSAETAVVRTSAPVNCSSFIDQSRMTTGLRLR